MKDLTDMQQIANALGCIDTGLSSTGDPSLAGSVVLVAEAMQDIASAIRELAKAVESIDVGH